MLGLKTTSDPGSSGMKEIAGALGGGIRERSLVIIEGEARTGKSVLTQHLAFGVLNSKTTSVSYYSSELEPKDLIDQMASMNMDIRPFMASDRLRAFKVDSQNVMRDAEEALQIIISHIMDLPERFQMAIVDTPSPFMTRVSPTLKIDFLQACKEMCEDGRSIVLALDTHVFEKKTLYRAYHTSDYYLKLTTQDMVIDTGLIDTRVIKILEIMKLCGSERFNNQGIRFEIKPKSGIQLFPFVQVRI